MIALDDNQITCPESLLPAGSYPEDAYTWVVRSKWSPSGEMVLIYHGCPECDYIGLGYLNYEALVAVDGSRFFYYHINSKGVGEAGGLHWAHEKTKHQGI